MRILFFAKKLIFFRDIQIVFRFGSDICITLLNI